MENNDLIQTPISELSRAQHHIIIYCNADTRHLSVFLFDKYLPYLLSYAIVGRLLNSNNNYNGRGDRGIII